MKLAQQAPSIQRHHGAISTLVELDFGNAITSSDGYGPTHGNYCGLGRTDRKFRKPAIDAVDAVCKKHDKCWKDTHLTNCGCDRRFLAQMAQAIGKQGLSAKARAYGAGAIAYFSQARCTCARKVCYRYPSCSWRGCKMKKKCNMVPYGHGRGGIGPC